jgi:hypothetical protein
MRTLAEIQPEVERLAATIGVSSVALPTYGCSADFGRPHIEVSDLQYHYVAVERGMEISRVTTFDFNELLFRIFSDVTFHLAVEFELKHRLDMQDCRRIIFDCQIQLLSTLFPAWADRELANHVKILEASPFDDLAGYYASRIGNYRRAGCSYSMACKLAALDTKNAKLIASFKRLIKRTPS